MLSKNIPQVSSLLVSEPFMLDPNFKRSVVLLTEYDESVMGFILNQMSSLQLQDVLPDMPDCDFPVYIGGPVGSDTLHFIHRCYDKMNSGVEVTENVFWGGNFETLKALIQNKLIDKTEVKFFIGYSGWDSEQLKDELKQNSWLVHNRYNSELLFVEDEENLWKEVVVSMGQKFAHIANFPENPMWN